MATPPPEPTEPTQGDQPGWWRTALELETGDKLKEAEATLTQAVPPISAAVSIAELYALRMRRFQRAGDEARAREAFARADQWIFAYASQATSGGEGAALSAERDRFRAALVRQFGYDPDAKDA